MASHTPGPWAIAGDGFIVTDEDDDWILPLNCIRENNREANARLIAAAPELLWLAQQVDAYADSLIRGDRDPTMPQFVAKARAALAKVGGMEDG